LETENSLKIIESKISKMVILSIPNKSTCEEYLLKITHSKLQQRHVFQTCGLQEEALS
jgi:hypothetical protein